MQSDSSGNYSESDQINKCFKFKSQGNSRNLSIKQDINDMISDQEFDDDHGMIQAEE